MEKPSSRDTRTEELRELYTEADLRDAKKRKLLSYGITAVIAVLIVIAYFVITAEPEQSPTALRLAQGIGSFGLAFEGHREYPAEEGAAPIWVEPTPEETHQRLSEALTIFNEVALNPGSEFDRDTAVLYVGMCALHLGNLDQAEEKLTQAAESPFEPIRQQARHTLGSVLLERGQLEEALEYYRDLADEEDNYLATTARLETSRILAWLGRPEESRAVLEEIVASGGEEDMSVLTTQRMLDQGMYLTTLVDLIPLTGEVEPVEIPAEDVTPTEGVTE
ncbi:tetratricopeptide repeat protein [bacterium]|nr:tetratricopeptide repeat protein [bacterium]